MKEYDNVNKGDSERPYSLPGSGDAKDRYGGKKDWARGEGGATSHPGEGPEGTEKGGRKPEGR